MNKSLTAVSSTVKRIGGGVIKWNTSVQKCRRDFSGIWTYDIPLTGGRATTRPSGLDKKLVQNI